MKHPGFIGMICIEPELEIHTVFEKIKNTFNFIEFKEIQRDDVISFIAEDSNFRVALYGAPQDTPNALYGLDYVSYTDSLLPSDLEKEIKEKNDFEIHVFSKRYEISSQLASWIKRKTNLNAFK
ncbi:hypothetical protein [Hahella sp. HN01]|uniref:hypothetical protein n=1 Tax=Hahella sp. HN01 TaxID=2847262 RepID=UPI001C1ED0FB|nr:hypothetical protein [Hahella sp. HN01]MBU6954284.1 hypothetical protein [Hahella sp. HN01]